MPARPKAPPVIGEWLNCEPFPQTHWRDRVTVLLFWAVSCEASWVRLGQLERLKSRLGDRVTVIAVHSPRHQSDRDVAAVRSAVQRHRVAVAVVHDADLETIGHYGIEGRPASVVIDHRGRVIGVVEGLDDLALIDEAATLADGVAAQARERSGSAPAPLPTVHTDLTQTLDQLRWPSGVCVLPSGELVVADHGNDRLVTLEANEDHTAATAIGEVAGVVGVGRVCALGGMIVAVSFPDHGRVEAVDLETGIRTPVLEDLTRPQGLTLDADGSLLIADAGTEQLVRVNADGSWGPVAGSGFTGFRDGDAGSAELAQPVGVCRLDHGVLFAESGSSALRLLTDKGKVLTLTAHDREGDRLVDPGLVDGPAHGARLEGPSDVLSLGNGSVVVADRGNDRLRTLIDRKIRTVPLAGLNRPEALAKIDANRVIVADTGNHRLVVVDLDQGSSWVMDIRSLRAPTPVRQPAPRGSEPLRAVAGGALVLDYPTPGPGPWTIRVNAEPSWLLTRPITVRRSLGDQPVVAHLSGAGTGEIVVEVAAVNGSFNDSTRRAIIVAPS